MAQWSQVLIALPEDAGSTASPHRWQSIVWLSMNHGQTVLNHTHTSFSSRVLHSIGPWCQSRSVLACLHAGAFFISLLLCLEVIGKSNTHPGTQTLQYWARGAEKAAKQYTLYTQCIVEQSTYSVNTQVNMRKCLSCAGWDSRRFYHDTQNHLKHKLISGNFCVTFFFFLWAIVDFGVVELLESKAG